MTPNAAQLALLVVPLGLIVDALATRQPPQAPAGGGGHDGNATPPAQNPATNRGENRASCDT